MCLTAGQIRFAHHVASIVDPVRLTVISSQCPQIPKHSAVPKEGVEGQIAARLDKPTT